MKQQKHKNNVSPIEEELDEIRDKMWEEAGKDTKQWVALVRKLAKQACLKYNLKGCSV